MFLYSPQVALISLANWLNKWPVNPDQDIMDIEIHVTGWNWIYVHKRPENQWEFQSGTKYITKQDWLQLKEVTDVARSLTRQTHEMVAPTEKAIFECFRTHCYKPGYEPHIWDDGFIGAFEGAQDYLIEIGMINSDH